MKLHTQSLAHLTCENREVSPPLQRDRAYRCATCGQRFPAAHLCNKTAAARPRSHQCLFLTRSQPSRHGTNFDLYPTQKISHLHHCIHYKRPLTKAQKTGPRGNLRSLCGSASASVTPGSKLNSFPPVSLNTQKTLSPTLFMQFSSFEMHTTSSPIGHQLLHSTNLSLETILHVKPPLLHQHHALKVTPI